MHVKQVQTTGPPTAGSKAWLPARHYGNLLKLRRDPEGWLSHPEASPRPTPRSVGPTLGSPLAAWGDPRDQRRAPGARKRLTQGLRAVLSLAAIPPLPLGPPTTASSLPAVRAQRPTETASHLVGTDSRGRTTPRSRPAKVTECAGAARGPPGRRKERRRARPERPPDRAVHHSAPGGRGGSAGEEVGQGRPGPAGSGGPRGVSAGVLPGDRTSGSAEDL